VICDFGLVRCITSSSGKDVVMTDYVATYRAPEIFLGSTKYGTQADMWLVGLKKILNLT
jgi:serine/threonine protein kinase